MCVKLLRRVQLFATLWIILGQTSLPMGFSRQEYWSGSPCPPPGDLPNPGIKPVPFTSTCIGRQVLYHQSYLGSPYVYNRHPNYSNRVRKTKYFYFLIHRLKMIIKVFQAVNGFCRFSEPPVLSSLLLGLSVSDMGAFNIM